MNSDNQIIRGGYTIGKSIASGSYGIVRLAQKDMTQFAIKISNISGNMGMSEIIEVDVVKRINHPNIIKFIDIFVDEVISDRDDIYSESYCPNNYDPDADHDLCIFYVMLLADQTLESKIEQLRTCTPFDKLQLIYKIIAAVSFLHTNNIYHGDLKPKNILMFGDIPVIADFGLSGYLHVKEYSPGTLAYAAPEVVYVFNAKIFEHHLKLPSQYIDELKRVVDDKRKLDVWSLGMIIGEILTGDYIFSPQGFSSILDDQDKYLRDKNIHEIYIPLLKLLLDPHPITRLSDLNHVLSLPIFSSMTSIPGTIINHNKLSFKRDFSPFIEHINNIYKSGSSTGSKILAGNILCRCFDLVCEDINDISIIIAACVLIASKLYMIECFHVEKLCDLCVNRFEPRDLIKMEAKIVIKLSGIMFTNILVK